MHSDIRIVLVNTTHAGNIGAAARAMKNMYLEQLVLVAPRSFPNAEATARASGADDILADARVVDTLDDALIDCRMVVGASARLRSVQWPQLDPRECAAQSLIAAEQGPVAIVFGRESSGLTNEELDRCTHLVHIPANEGYSSLNVAMAVQVIAYELMMVRRDGIVTAAADTLPVASRQAMEGFFEHLEQALDDIGFIEQQRSEKLMRRLRRLFHRAAPDALEVNILRGILSAAQGRKSMRREDGE